MLSELDRIRIARATERGIQRAAAVTRRNAAWQPRPVLRDDLPPLGLEPDVAQEAPATTVASFAEGDDDAA